MDQRLAILLVVGLSASVAISACARPSTRSAPADPKTASEATRALESADPRVPSRSAHGLGDTVRVGPTGKPLDVTLASVDVTETSLLGTPLPIGASLEDFAAPSGYEYLHITVALSRPAKKKEQQPRISDDPRLVLIDAERRLVPGGSQVVGGGTTPGVITVEELFLVRKGEAGLTLVADQLMSSWHRPVVYWIR